MAGRPHAEPARRPSKSAGTSRRLLAGAAVLAAAATLARVLRHPNVRITDPDGPPRIDASGTARSIQAAELTIDPAALDTVWSPAGLARLAETYWRFLARIGLGLIRVIQTPEGRRVVLLARPVVLLAFDPPEYLLDHRRGLIRWPITGGLLAARRPAGHPETVDGRFSIELLRLEPAGAGGATLGVEVAVVDFRPSIARILGPTVYAFTQARIHVLVTHAFMRSLGPLRLAGPPTASGGAPPASADVPPAPGDVPATPGDVPAPPGDVPATPADVPPAPSVPPAPGDPPAESVSAADPRPATPETTAPKYQPDSI